eukprot:364367-Chlamydomonas_euryale.AAC.3
MDAWRRAGLDVCVRSRTQIGRGRTGDSSDPSGGSWPRPADRVAHRCIAGRGRDARRSQRHSGSRRRLQRL